MEPKKLLWLFLIFTLILASCQPSAPEATPTVPLSPELVYTSAAQTAEALRVVRFTQTSFPSPEELLATSNAPTPTETFTPAPTATATAGPTATSAPVDTGQMAAGDKVEFVADLTVPDGTIYQPNQSFTKTWRLKNAGSTTWTTAYSLVFANGALMSGPASQRLMLEAAPGTLIDISVDLIAPADAGSHRGYWYLQNAEGKNFGVGLNADEPFWVDIKVAGEVSPDATQAPAAGGAIVSNVILSTEEAKYSGSCPHTFIFTAQFTLNSPTTVTYRLEAGSNADFELKLPSPTTNNLDAGTHTVVYQLEFAQDISGWVRLHFGAPEDVFSNQVNFQLSCP